jgi:hypothetical protein
MIELSYKTYNTKYNIKMQSMKVTRSGRKVKEPRRFQNERFTAGSGFVGCDHYDNGYDNGKFYGNYKDRNQAIQDSKYTKDLEKAMMVEESTSKLPDEIGIEISRFLMRKSIFQSDINFIAPDNIEPLRQIENDNEEEWETGDETSEDEEEWYESDEE